MGVREPQCASVKRLSLVINQQAEADALHFAAGSNVHSISRECTGSVGVIERGERTNVLYVYLGDLIYSVTGYCDR